MPRTTLLFPTLLCLAVLSLLDGSAQAERLRPDGGSTLRLHNAAGAPTTGCWLTGAQVLDSDAAAWLCTVAGCPGTWVQYQTGADAPVTAADVSLDPAALVYVAATDVQEGVDDLDDAIGTVSAAVTAHTGAAAGAHDASAIALAEIVGLVADNVQAAVAALFVQVQAAQSTADNHVAAAEAAHQATAIAYTDSLELGTTTVQGAIDATIGLVGEHQNEPAGAHAATAISLEAIVGLASSNVQAGIAELLVAVQAAQGDATGAGIDAGIADALAESVATDRVCHARAGLDWSDAAGDDFSVAADQYDAIDREVYALATAGSGSQAVGLVQQVCAPQRGAILSAVRVTYKVGGTASLVVRVKGADGTVCTDTGSPPTGTSATKAALSAGDVTGCTATPGEPLDVIATCYSSAVADTCSIGHVDVAWGR